MDTIKIKLGKYEKDVSPCTDMATCLEFVLTWGDASDDNVDLIRVCSAAIGVALDSEALLPKYRPDSDKILQYGRKVLTRLLLKEISMNDIFQSGTAFLTEMSKNIPQQKEVEEKMNFFHSTEEDD